MIVETCNEHLWFKFANYDVINTLVFVLLTDGLAKIIFSLQAIQGLPLDYPGGT
jgi:hypothetical protein